VQRKAGGKVKLVIDKSPDGKWRWSLVTVNGVSVKVHATGVVDGDALAAFNAGWTEAVVKGYVKEQKDPVP
jgi:hypothetical protein